MALMVLRRVLAIIPLIFIATLITFGMVFLLPGDPATRIAGEGATPEQIAQVTADLGLDRNVVERYGTFVWNMLHGDLGNSYTYNVPVTNLIMERLPITLSLAIVAIVMAVLIGLPAGMVAGRRAGAWPDRMTTFISTLGLAIPNFVLALLLVMFLAVNNHWLPATGYQPISAGVDLWLKHLLLPGFALAVMVAAEITRQLRGSLVDVLQQDYIRTAVAKGVSNRGVVSKHALKNAMMPVITVMGMQIAYLLGGTAVIESVFGIKGLGDLAVQSVLARDLPTIQGIVIFTVIVTLVASLLVDLTYTYLNPKVRRS